MSSAQQESAVTTQASLSDRLRATACGTRPSQLLLGQLAERVGNRARRHRAPPRHSRPPPSRSGRGSCRPRGRRRSAPAPLLLPGRRLSSASPSGRSSCRPVALLEMRHRDRQQRDGPLVRVVGEHAAHQLLGDLGKHRGCRDRLVERDRARHRAQVGEAHAHRHRPPRPRLRPQPRARPGRRDAAASAGTRSPRPASCRAPIARRPNARAGAS